jgi:hypothetical protein
VPILRSLYGRLAAGEAVVFRQGPGEGTEVVPSRCVESLLREIESIGIVPASAGDPQFDHLLEAGAGLKRGTLRRIRQPGGRAFVKLGIYRALADLRDGTAYDPCRHYEVGDRLHHHDLGTGTVVEKRHKSRMLVEFGDGTKRLLREDVRMDPRWPHPMT